MITSPIVQRDRRNFLTHIAPWIGTLDHDAVAAGLDRVLEWTGAKGDALVYRAPSGKDPLLGATIPSGSVLFWGIYPRRADGGKVTLFPGSAARLPQDAHREMAATLEALHPGLVLKPNQNLCMSLQRLSHPEVWRQYAALLDVAYSHMVRITQ